jgi:hypothetical protein
VLAASHGEGGIGALVLAASQGDGGIGALVFASACTPIALVNTSKTNTATNDHLDIDPSE